MKKKIRGDFANYAALCNKHCPRFRFIFCRMDKRMDTVDTAPPLIFF
jgi:hypothetical protein